jgi:hypothetical protein
MSAAPTPKNGCWIPTSGNKGRCTLRLDLAGGTGIASGEIARGAKLHAFMRRARNGASEVVLTRNTDGTTTVSSPLLFGDHCYRSGAAGSITMTGSSPTRAAVRIRCGKLGIDQTLQMKWDRRHFRDLTIELDKIAAETFPRSVQYKGKTWTLKKIFDAAGFNTKVIRSHRTIPDQDAPWSDGELHQAMERYRRANPSPWSTHVLLVSAYDDPEAAQDEYVLGIMYDADTSLGGAPREGSAVFLTGIRNVTSGTATSAAFAREVLMTAAHEIGHTLNLTHSFEKGRPDSASLMNYPEEHPSGASGYYRIFNFSFDDEELVHLRHHSPKVAEPGALGGLSFWGSSFRRRGARPRWNLTLQLGTHEALPGEPLYGQLSLRPSSGHAKARTTLDWSARDVDIEVRGPNGTWTRVLMPITRCRRAPARVLSASNPLVRDVPLVVGAQGDIFPNVGNYLVRAVARLRVGKGTTLVTSSPVSVKIRAPRTAQERELRKLLARPGTKRFMLLRGGAFDRKATDAVARVASIQPHRLCGRLASMALVESGRSRMPLPSEPTAAPSMVARLHRVAPPSAARTARPPDILSRAMSRLASRIGSP